MRIRIALFLIVFLIFSSCKRATEQKELDNGFITEVGVYNIGRNEFRLFKVSDGALSFEMKDSTNNFLIERSASSGFNDFHRWALYFDDHKNLWYYSGDLGETFVWVKDQNGQYTCHNFCSEQLDIPQVFLDRIKKTKDFCNKYN